MTCPNCSVPGEGGGLAESVGCTIIHGNECRHSENCRRCGREDRIDIPEEYANEIAERAIPVWKEGKRHFLSLGLAGALIKAGYSEESISALVEGICHKAGDREWRSRLAGIRATFRQLESGSKEPGKLSGTSMIWGILHG